MAINKVVYGTETLVDLTEDTVTAQTLAEGATAHAADGSIVTGVVQIVDISQYQKKITISDTNLTAGESPLASGEVYLVYE